MTLSNQRPFRFGVTVSRADSAEGWWAEMRRVEAAGYSTLLVADWLGPVLAPLPALAIAAASTTRLRVGTWALANDFRNPVLVAREAATLDLLTDGRFELGLGAGRTDNGYASLGLHPDAGGVRVRRLAESVRIIKALFRGETVTVTGEHYSISGATLYPPVRHRVPVLLAAAGRRAIELAAREADAVAIGTRSAAELSDSLEWMRAAAGERFSQIELGMRLWVLPDGDERARQTAVAVLAGVGADLDAMMAAGAPGVISGSPAAMAEQLEERRARFGLFYVVVDQGVMDTFAPVVERLAGR